MNFKLISCFLLLILIPCYNIFSQEAFQKFFGTNLNDEGNSLIKLSDNNLMLACATAENNSTNRDILLIKMDSNGNTIWSKNYGGSNDEVPRVVIETSDSGFAVLGSTKSFGFGGEDIFLIKLDQNGDIQWSKVYGGSNQERGFTLQQTSDGGFILGGSTKSNSNGNHDAIFLKTNAFGDVEWSRSMGGSSTDNCFDIKPTSDGGYIFTGSQDNYGSGSWDYWLVKITAAGNLSWAKAYGGFGEEHSRIVNEANDGGFIIIGHTTTWGAGGWDILLVKTDENGNEQWSKVYGGDSNEFAGSFTATGNAYYIASYSESFGDERDFLLLKIDNNGNMSWAKNYGFPGEDVLPFGSQNSILKYNSESLFLIGKVASGQLGGSDIILQKMNIEGESGCNFDIVNPQTDSPAITTTNVNISVDINGSYQSANFLSSDFEIFSEFFCNLPIASFTPSDTLICEGTCIDFIDNSFNDPDSWLWSFQGGNPSFSSIQNPNNICFNAPGLFEVQLIVSNLAGSDTTFRIIEVLEAPDIDLGTDTTLCPDQLLTLSIDDPSITSLEWSNGSNLEMITVSNPGIYWVIAQNGNCDVSDSITINYNQPEANLGTDISICEGETVLLASFQNGANYLWQDGSTNTTFEASQEGWYSVEVIIGNCNDIDSLFLDINPIPFIDIGVDTIICQNHTLTLDAYFPDAEYLWNDGSISASIQVAQAGIYEVEVSLNNCISTDMIEIMNFPSISAIDIGMDTTLCLGFELILNASAENANEFVWSNNIQGQSISVSESGSYFVTASNECESITSNIIDVIFENCNCGFYIPNVFTPDYDGVNDVFRPSTNCEVIQYNLKIFGRWGEFVFESNEFNIGWDGTFKSKNAISDVYIYLIDAVSSRNGFIENIQLKGDVTLIR
jgi:gliding motility-associated-like protein